jgi:hypothetical protein
MRTRTYDPAIAKIQTYDLTIVYSNRASVIKRNLSRVALQNYIDWYNNDESVNHLAWDFHSFT